MYLLKCCVLLFALILLTFAPLGYAQNDEKQPVENNGKNTQDSPQQAPLEESSPQQAPLEESNRKSPLNGGLAAPRGEDTIGNEGGPGEGFNVAWLFSVISLVLLAGVAISLIAHIRQRSRLNKIEQGLAEVRGVRKVIDRHIQEFGYVPNSVTEHSLKLRNIGSDLRGLKQALKNLESKVGDGPEAAAAAHQEIIETTIREELKEVLGVTQQVSQSLQDEIAGITAHIDRSTQEAVTAIRDEIKDIAKHIENPHPAMEAAIRDAEQRVFELARSYEDGEPIDLDTVDSDSPTPAQNILQLLNAMARQLGEWKAGVEATHPALASQLSKAEGVIKGRLKTLRGGAPRLLKLEIEASEGDMLDSLQRQCTAYADQFSSTLAEYELGREVDVDKYEQFIPDFVKDRVFKNMATAVPFEQLPGQVNPFLALIGWEVMPIEIGKTAADSRVHDIQASQRTAHASGTVAEVIVPGLIWKSDNRMIQKALVIRAE